MIYLAKNNNLEKNKSKYSPFNMDIFFSLILYRGLLLKEIKTVYKKNGTTIEPLIQILVVTTKAIFLRNIQNQDVLFHYYIEIHNALREICGHLVQWRIKM